MEEYIQLISNVGFPIFAYFYLILRFEKKLDKLTDAIETLRNRK